MLSLDTIIHLLAGRPAKTFPGEDRTRAAVAMILRATDAGPEILFIERARHDHDPWSGDLGFPGGKVEADDRSPRKAAERETGEEVGLDLAAADCLGRLDDLAGAHLPIIVSCFVYALDGSPSLRFNHEVAAAFWFSMAKLRDPRRHVLAPVRFGSQELQRPALSLLEPGRPVLWGITYRLVSHFLDILGSPLKPVTMPIREERSSPDDLTFAGCSTTTEGGRE